MTPPTYFQGVMTPPTPMIYAPVTQETQAGPTGATRPCNQPKSINAYTSCLIVRTVQYKHYSHAYVLRGVNTTVIL